MTAETHRTGATLHLGPFAVRADAAEAAAFAAALQLPPCRHAVPLTFAIRWLALPPIRAAMEEAIGTPCPLLASQGFDYQAGIALDRDYSFRVAIRSERTTVSHVSVRGSLTDQDTGLAMGLETVLYPATVMTAGMADYAAPASTLPEIDVGPIDMPQAARYAAAARDDNRLHLDRDAARSHGLDAPIVHGMMLMGLFQKALSEWRMDAPVTRLFARFIRPVPLGSRPVIGGRLVPRAGGAAAGHDVVRLSVRVGSSLACIGEALMRDGGPSGSPTP